jgi:GNAT superfamily N-acetyltransferase
MEFELLGWPTDGPTLELDYREFSYAGKFVMSSTGKAVARESTAATGGDADEGDATADIVAAAAFDEDRDNPGICRIRYITVRSDRRGDGIGPQLAAFVGERARQRGYDRARIAVNNPFAYQALYRAGFWFTGEETGVAELVLDRAFGGEADRSRATYQSGLDVYRQRDLSAEESAFLDDKRRAGPPAVVDAPGAT